MEVAPLIEFVQNILNCAADPDCFWADNIEQDLFEASRSNATAYQTLIDELENVRLFYARQSTTETE